MQQVNARAGRESFKFVSVNKIQTLQEQLEFLVNLIMKSAKRKITTIYFKLN